MSDAPVRINPTAAPSSPSAIIRASSPTGTPIFSPGLARYAVPVVVVAGFVASLPAMGVPVPPVAVAVASLVVSLGAALGVASPGVRK